MFQTEKQMQKVVSTLGQTIENFIGIKTSFLGGVKKAEISADGFDTFFLSERNNEWQKNFVKLLYGFTEKDGGPMAARSQSTALMAHEHDVH